MSRSRLPFHLSPAAVTALGIGLLATSVLFSGLRRLEHDKVQLDFQQRAQVRALAVQEQMEETVQVLRGLNQVFTTFEVVSREQFHTFTQPLLRHYSYVQAFNFHRFIADGQRTDYEEGMRRRHPGYVMLQMQNGKSVPAQKRDRHLVIDYIEPFAGNEITLGLDVSSNVDLNEAVQDAIDTGEARSTGLLTLAQGDGRLRGFLVVMPVYRHSAVLDSIATRRREAIGDTAAVFNAAVLIEQILAVNGLLNDDRIDISVYASEIEDERHLAFRTGAAPLEQEVSALPHWLFHDRPDSLVQGFNVAGRPWHMVVSAPPVFFTAKHSGSVWGLVAGLLFSFLMAAYLQALSSRSRRVHQLVEQRTTELRLANDLLSEDIAARKRAEDALQLRQRAIEASANAIIITSALAPRYPIEYVNPAFERITGYVAADVIGRSPTLLWADDREQADIPELLAAVREQREGHAILRSYGKQGQLFWSDVYLAPVRDECGEVNHFVVALYDITATKRYQAELELQACQDSLTGLANRSLLQSRLQHACARAERDGNAVWVLFINLDRFKFVNDTLGHRAGDHILQTVAQRLQSAARDGDTIARLSADEFVLVLPGSGAEDLSRGVVQRFMDIVAQPIAIDSYVFVMGCSIGIAVGPADGYDAESLVKYAGIAMYRAKEAGRNNYQFYTDAMNIRAMERLRIEGDLRHAIERGEFVLHYQPQIDLHTGSILGMEALLRWQHPVLGKVSPARFIDVAEEMGLIVPIGLWALRTACQQNAAWHAAGLGEVRVAVNLSARQFYQQDLAASIKAILHETGLSPHLLELELTESMMMNDVEHAVSIMRSLKAIGVHLSIDDFGTGYSSLAYLKRFPIDLLKIDRSFVRDITTDPDDAAIVLSIISLAHSLRLKVIAEGVETDAQHDYLQRHGCDYMQGYYFSRPLPAHDCEQLLRRNNSPRIATDDLVA